MPPHRSVPLGIRRALVVDDDAEYGHVIADALGPNFRSELVQSADEAMAALRAGPHDVVIIESNVAGADSVGELVTRLREIEPDVGIVVTSLVGLFARQTVQCFEAGADDYVPKPFHPAELRARVDRVARGGARRDSYEAGRKAPGGA